jgi:hypothetical protein
MGCDAELIHSNQVNKLIHQINPSSNARARLHASCVQMRKISQNYEKNSASPPANIQ